MLTIRENIEIFHLLFLKSLETRLDKKLYALKGGCNLRFFFKSIRYSEDIDLDVHTIAVPTLKNKINKMLESLDFKNILRSYQLEILQFTTPKQTETTQRWKIALKSKESNLSIPTKIEFSRRSLDSGTDYESVDPELLNRYRLYPILCSHYTRQSAFLQKLNALIYRTETQARDIFDLKLLLDRGLDIHPNLDLTEEERSMAIDRVNQVSYDDFKSQVVSYLMDEFQEHFNHKKWSLIQKQITEFLSLPHHETHSSRANPS